VVRSPVLISYDAGPTPDPCVSMFDAGCDVLQHARLILAHCAVRVTTEEITNRPVKC